MKKNVLINLRVNNETKESFQSIVSQEGYTMSQVLESFMEEITKKGCLPIYIKCKLNRKKQKVISIPFIKKCIDEIVAELNNRKIKSISLFGSYSTGNATHNSDVDLFLDVDSDFTLFELADLQNGLKNKIGKEIDLVTKNDDEYFMKHIQKERINLYERQ